MAVVDREKIRAPESTLRRSQSAMSNPNVMPDEALRLVQQIYLAQSTPPGIVVFAGVDAGSGCSQICAATAEALGKHSMRSVCLVDANFRSPAAARIFGIPNQQGLVDALGHDAPIRTFGKNVSTENLFVIPTGNVQSDSPSLLNAARLRDRFVELRSEFDFVCIDAPPLTKFSDAIALAQLADGLVLVLEAESTRRDAAQAVMASLQTVQVSVLAAVLNKRTYPIPQVIYEFL